jgi:hypothetical protein
MSSTATRTNPLQTRAKPGGFSPIARRLLRPRAALAVCALAASIAFNFSQLVGAAGGGAAAQPEADGVGALFTTGAWIAVVATRSLPVLCWWLWCAGGALLLHGCLRRASVEYTYKVQGRVAGVPFGSLLAGRRPEDYRCGRSFLGCMPHLAHIGPHGWQIGSKCPILHAK